MNTILRAQEKTIEVNNPTAVKYFDTNQLPSNNPIEDRRAEGRCVLTTGMMFGIFDGHAGSACAEVVSQRLFDYVAASFLPPELLAEFSTLMKQQGKSDDLILRYNNDFVFPQNLEKIYRDSLVKFVDELLSIEHRDFVMKDALVKAFQRLDGDLSNEARSTNGAALKSATLAVASSGCVACVSHVDGPHLHVANVGDCQAVVGLLDENNMWLPKRLTKEHNFENQDEVKRLLSEHPSAEADTVLKHDRLLGQLAPLRAFGDFRYKWNIELQKELFVPVLGQHVLPMNYHTPPYLTATPEITYHKLSPRDKFLVIGSDGLWEQLSPDKVVRLVGEYMSGRQTLDALKLPNKNMKLKEINDILLQRKEGLQNKPIDTNAATHLIRNALGGTEYGIEHGMLSQMLCAPEDMVRLLRDDITIIVVFFDSEYLRHCPA